MRERDKDTRELPQMRPTRDPKFDRDPKFNNEAIPGRDYVPTDAYAQEWVPPTPFQKVDQVIDHGIDAFARGYLGFLAALGAALAVWVGIANLAPWVNESGLVLFPVGFVFVWVSRRIVNGPKG